MYHRSHDQPPVISYLSALNQHRCAGFGNVHQPLVGSASLMGVMGLEVSSSSHECHNSSRKILPCIHQIRSLGTRKAIGLVLEERKNTVAEKSKRHSCEPIVGCHFAVNKLWDRGNLSVLCQDMTLQRIRVCLVQKDSNTFPACL